MNEEAKAAFVMAQAAMLNAEIAMMEAANQYRDRRGESIAYGEEEIHEVIKRYEWVLGHNGCLTYLQS